MRQTYLGALVGLVAGLIFGVGLTVSQMVNPAKVLSFLDIFGNWDPSLAFVMGAALVVAAVGYRVVHARPAPVLAAQFHLPTKRDIDGRLMGGALLFGIGWGLVGLCPGPAISAITLGGTQVLIFLAAMAAGMLVVEMIGRMRPSPA